MASRPADSIADTSWSRIILVYACGIVAAGQLGLLPPLVPALQRDLGITLTVASATISILTLIGAVLGLAAGNWAERIGHAQALGVGLLVMALAAALGAIAPGVTTLVVARGLAGLGYLLVIVAAPSLMALAAASSDRPMALALWGTFVPAGICVAQALAGIFAAQVGWRGLFWLDAVLLLLMLFGAHAAIPAHRSASVNAAATAALRDPAAIRVSGAFFCFAFVFLAIAALLPAYLAEIHGYTAAEAGQTVAIATASGIVGSLIAGWHMQRGGSPRGLTAFGLLASSAATGLIFVCATSPLLIGIGAVATFATGGLVPAAVFAWVPQLASRTAAIGPMNGLVAQFGSLGSLLGPPLLATWVSTFGWSAAPLFLLAVALTGALCLRRLAVPR